MKGLSYVRSRGTTACGGLVFRHADDHGPGGRAPGLSDQTVPGTLAGKGSQACRPYGETHHPTGDKGPRRSNRCRAACAEAGRRTVRRGRWSGQSLGQDVSRGRHGRAAAREQERRPGQQASGATGSGRRRRRGPAPAGRGAGTGERVDAGDG